MIICKEQAAGVCSFGFCCGVKPILMPVSFEVSVLFWRHPLKVQTLMSAISMISCFLEEELTDLRNGQGETDKASDGQYHSQHLFDFPERKYLR